MSPSPPPRREPIERLLSKWRVASRAEAGELVRGGRVRAAGLVVRDPRALVDPRDGPIEVDGVAVAPVETELVYLAANKPSGVVATTKDPEGRRTVMDLVTGPRAPGLAPVGRLDKASAGLLLLSNDAVLADRLLSPESHVTKRYRVKVRGHPSPAALARLRSETLVEDGLELGPIDVRVEAEGPKSSWLDVRLDEGKNRQIRRRLTDVGHDVEVLVRTEFGPILLGDLSKGLVRALSPAEVDALRAAGRGGDRRTRRS